MFLQYEYIFLEVHFKSRDAGTDAGIDVIKQIRYFPDGTAPH